MIEGCFLKTNSETSHTGPKTLFPQGSKITFYDTKCQKNLVNWKILNKCCTMSKKPVGVAFGLMQLRNHVKL